MEICTKNKKDWEEYSSSSIYCKEYLRWLKKDHYFLKELFENQIVQKELENLICVPFNSNMIEEVNIEKIIIDFNNTIIIQGFCIISHNRFNFYNIALQRKDLNCFYYYSESNGYKANDLIIYDLAKKIGEQIINLAMLYYYKAHIKKKYI